MTKHQIGTIYPNGVPARLLAFFDRNPTEGLTFEDIAEKFNCSDKTAREAVIRLRSLGKVSHEIIGEGRGQKKLIVAARAAAPIKFETLKDFLKRQTKEKA